MKLKIILSLAALAVSVACNAQTDKGYFIGKNFVSYNDSLMSDADVATFIDLGHGVAKDKNHVYNEGRIMEYADKLNGSSAATSNRNVAVNGNKDVAVNGKNDVDKDDDDSPSLLDKILWTDEVGNNYAVDGAVVSYKGKAIKKADASTFKYIGGDYAADKHHAYYKGRILGDAWGVGQFAYKGNGYATDGVHWYCNGKPVDRD